MTFDVNFLRPTRVIAEVSELLYPTLQAVKAYSADTTSLDVSPWFQSLQDHVDDYIDTAISGLYSDISDDLHDTVLGSLIDEFDGTVIQPIIDSFAANIITPITSTFTEAIVNPIINTFTDDIVTPIINAIPDITTIQEEVDSFLDDPVSYVNNKLQGSVQLLRDVAVNVLRPNEMLSTIKDKLSNIINQSVISSIFSLFKEE